MPYKREAGLFANWFIRGKVDAALNRHDEDGKMDGYELKYIGDSRRIEDIVLSFEQSSGESNVNMARLRARLSCTNRESSKWHVVSLYQTERDAGGQRLQLVEATWCTKAREPLGNVVEQIKTAFGELIESNRKYGNKPIEFVGTLHGYDS